jgi:hypothetical protein
VQPRLDSLLKCCLSSLFSNAWEDMRSGLDTNEKRFLR